MKIVVLALMLVAFLAALFVVEPPQDLPASVRKLAEMDGHCRAEINGRSVRCEPIATYFRLVNDRTVLTFTLDGTVYAFSGCNWTPRAPEAWTLEVDLMTVLPDGAPKRRYEDVTGDCVVQTRGGLAGTFTSIDCAARPAGVPDRYRVRFDQIWKFQVRTNRERQPA